MASVSRRGILCRRADNPIEISISVRVREAKSAESAPGRRKKTQAGNWKSETGNWKLENGNLQRHFPVSSFQFPVSRFSFHPIPHKWSTELGFFLDSSTPRVWRSRLDSVENGARFVENILC
jgi:hypothetical protein